MNTDLLDSPSGAESNVAVVTAMLVAIVFYALGAMLTHSDDRKAAREVISAVERDVGRPLTSGPEYVKHLGERMDKAGWFDRTPIS